MPQSPFNHETSPLLGDLEMGHIGMAKTINNSYSLPRGGVASLKELIPILDYCSVQIVNVPETFRIVFNLWYFDFESSKARAETDALTQFKNQYKFPIQKRHRTCDCIYKSSKSPSFYQRITQENEKSIHSSAD